jgi:hypothetical protein
LSTKKQLNLDNIDDLERILKVLREERGLSERKALHQLGSVYMRGKTEGDIDDLLKECRRTRNSEGKKEQRRKEHEVTFSDVGIGCWDKLAWEPFETNFISLEDQLKLHELETESLWYLVCHGKEINERLGYGVVDILVVLIKDPAISITKICQKTLLLDKTVDRRLAEVRKDEKLLKELPFLAKILNFRRK